MTQAQALDILKLGDNVFLTGAAGSGKTYVLNQYIDLLKRHGVGVAVTALTGIAATHLGGVTIHSWSGIGIRNELSKSEVKNLFDKAYLRKRFAATNVLIIDEASMLQPSLFNLINKVCKAFKESERPFGGMQVILSGDLFQLSPITDETPVKYFTESLAWDEMKPRVCYLAEQYRHNDNQLSDILNAIRSNTVHDGTLASLQTRYKAMISVAVRPTRLYTHNIDVDRINEQELLKISHEPGVYEMWSRGRKSLVQTLINSCLAPDVLRLKEGAIVMFVKNNFERGYVNGTLGVITGFEEDTNYPIVKTYYGKSVIASPECWSIEEEGKVRAGINQIPLRLAWAITVHKSQGMTLDAAEIDLSKSFVPGMGYVALSRVRSLSGLRLMGLNKVALMVDERLSEIDKTLQTQSQVVAQFINSLGEIDKKERQQTFIKQYATRKVQEKKIPTIDQTKALIEQKKSIETIAQERGYTAGTIVGHLERLKARGDRLDINYLKPKVSRFAAMVRAFAVSDDTRLAPVKEILGDDYSYEELRLVRLFLEE